MKTISEALRGRIEADTLSLYLCWRLERRDGAVFGLTDHDRTLVVDGELYVPGLALEAGTFALSKGLKPDQGAARGVLSADFITEDDLALGLWNGCSIRVSRVDWDRPDLGRIPVWGGYLSEVVSAPSGGFEAELVSLKADLERPIGRNVQRRCDAVLGDERCGVSADGRVCDKRFETCRDTFSNIENFRGFPHLPGMDFVLAGPAAGKTDGGKR